MATDHTTTTSEEFGDTATRVTGAIIATYRSDRAAIERIRDSFIGAMEKQGAHIVLNEVVVKLDAYLETAPGQERFDLAAVISP